MSGLFSIWRWGRNTQRPYTLTVGSWSQSSVSDSKYLLKHSGKFCPVVFNRQWRFHGWYSAENIDTLTTTRWSNTKYLRDHSVFKTFRILLYTWDAEPVVWGTEVLGERGRYQRQYFHRREFLWLESAGYHYGVSLVYLDFIWSKFTKQRSCPNIFPAAFPDIPDITLSMAP